MAGGEGERFVPYTLKYSCMCHQGRIRSTNQDNLAYEGICLPMEHDSMEKPVYGTARPECSPVFAIFDGMGGEERGEAASYLAADLMKDWPMEDGETALETFCLESNHEICRFAATNMLGTCGTTAAILSFSEQKVLGCNIGDSRIYRIRGDAMEQLSEDHVFDMGPGRKPPLLQFLGLPEEETRISPQIFTEEPVAGDRYLICSDGITDMIREAEILKIIQETPWEEAADRLLSQALTAGGRDNITFFLVQIL